MIIQMDFTDPQGKRIGGEQGAFFNSAKPVPVPAFGDEVVLDGEAYTITRRKFEYDFNYDDDNKDTFVRVEFVCTQSEHADVKPNAQPSWC